MPTFSQATGWPCRTRWRLSLCQEELSAVLLFSVEAALPDRTHHLLLQADLQQSTTDCQGTRPIDSCMSEEQMRVKTKVTYHIPFYIITEWSCPPNWLSRNKTHKLLHVWRKDESEDKSHLSYSLRQHYWVILPQPFPITGKNVGLNVHRDRIQSIRDGGEGEIRYLCNGHLKCSDLQKASKTTTTRTIHIKVVGSQPPQNNLCTSKLALSTVVGNKVKRRCSQNQPLRTTEAKDCPTYYVRAWLPVHKALGLQWPITFRKNILLSSITSKRERETQRERGVFSKVTSHQHPPFFTPTVKATFLSHYMIYEITDKK